MTISRFEPDPCEGVVNDLYAKIDEVDALERKLAATEARADRYFEALKRALPGHYDHVLWMAYTLNRPAVFDKREAWRKSDKCKVARFDGEHWLRSLGLQDGDWSESESGR